MGKNRVIILNSDFLDYNQIALLFLTFVPDLNRSMQKLKKLSTFSVLTILAYFGALMEGWLQTIAYNLPRVHDITLKLNYYVKSKIFGKVA